MPFPTGSAFNGTDKVKADLYHYQKKPKTSIYKNKRYNDGIFPRTQPVLSLMKYMRILVCQQEGWNTLLRRFEPSV